MVWDTTKIRRRSLTIVPQGEKIKEIKNNLGT
jgi:hypothetical protein